MDVERFYNDSVDLLNRSPLICNDLFHSTPVQWLVYKSSEEKWNSLEILAHLIHCEEAGWISRINLILGSDNESSWVPFSRTAHLEEMKGKSTDSLLKQFATARRQSMAWLTINNLSVSELKATYSHPILGMVSVSELISTWAAHDQNHLNQISNTIQEAIKKIT